MPSNHLILCHPVLLLPSIFPSIRVFSNESSLHIKWPKYWSFSFNISPSNEHPGLIFFRMDWLDLFAKRDSQESSLTPQFKSINSLALNFLHSQLSYPYMTTGKTIALSAAAAKSLQSRLTLCNPIDSSPPGSSVHGIFQARVLEWGAIAFSVFMKSFH